MDKNCSSCGKWLNPPLKSGRQVCSYCGWSNKSNPKSIRNSNKTPEVENLRINAIKRNEKGWFKLNYTFASISLFVVFIGLVLFGKYLYFDYITDNPKKIVEDFLTEIKKGNLEDAAQYSCNTTQGIQTDTKKFFSVQDWKFVSQEFKNIKPMTRFPFKISVIETNTITPKDFVKKHFPEQENTVESLSNLRYFKIIGTVNSSDEKGIPLRRNSEFIVLNSQDSEKYSALANQLKDAIDKRREAYDAYTKDWNDETKYLNINESMRETLIRSAALDYFIYFVNYSSLKYIASKSNKKYCLSHIHNSGDSNILEENF